MNKTESRSNPADGKSNHPGRNSKNRNKKANLNPILRWPPGLLNGWDYDNIIKEPAYLFRSIPIHGKKYSGEGYKCRSN
jgi:hypothetical protein